MFFVKNTLFKGSVKIMQTTMQVVKYSCSICHSLQVISSIISNENYV